MFGLDAEHWRSEGDARRGLARLLGHGDQELAWAYTPDDPYWV